MSVIFNGVYLIIREYSNMWYLCIIMINQKIRKRFLGSKEREKEQHFKPHWFCWYDNYYQYPIKEMVISQWSLGK